MKPKITKGEINSIKPEFKKTWVAALRSNDYQQGWGCLRGFSQRDTFHCALGVACDLWAKEMVIKGFEVDDFSYSGQMPVEIRDDIGISLNFCKFLIYLNDQEKQSFLQIADFLDSPVVD